MRPISRHLRIIILGKDVPLQFRDMHDAGGMLRHPGRGEDEVGQEGGPDGFSEEFGKED